MAWIGPRLMITIADVIRFERNCARQFADAAERDYGWLFHQRDNPTSHDSNHALILDLRCDLDAATADLGAFYTGLGVWPRVYQSYEAGEDELLLPKLLAAGYQVETNEDRFFVWSSPSAIQPLAGFELRRVREPDPRVMDIIEQPNTWSSGVLRRQLIREDYHLVVGYAGDTAVAFAAINRLGGFSQVDDVTTHPVHRRKGYGRALMHGLVQYHQRLCADPLFLCSGNSSAIRIYGEAGFRKMAWEPRRWSAWRP